MLGNRQMKKGIQSLIYIYIFDQDLKSHFYMLVFCIQPLCLYVNNLIMYTYLYMNVGQSVHTDPQSMLCECVLSALLDFCLD